MPEVVTEDAWPLSAAASAVLLDPGGVPATRVASLAIRELVGRGAWSSDVWVRNTFHATLAPVPSPPARPLPAPLDLLDARLRAVPLPVTRRKLDLTRLRDDMDAAHGRGWRDELADATRDSLISAGLLERGRRLGILRRLRRTPFGDQWAAELNTRLSAARVGGDVTSVARCGWTVLLAATPGDGSLLVRSRDAVRAARHAGTAGGATGLAFGGTNVDVAAQMPFVDEFLAGCESVLLLGGDGTDRPDVVDRAVEGAPSGEGGHDPGGVDGGGDPGGWGGYDGGDSDGGGGGGGQ